MTLQRNLTPLTGTERADMAFQAHRAMMIATALQRELQDNPYWTVLRQDAFERCIAAIEAM